jgi:N-acetylglutamate synthase-like GNAT family acetyltransferase
VATVRGYEPRDLETCRELWVELTQWHRDIFGSPEIGGSDPGRAFDEHLAKIGAENIWVAEVDGHVVGLTGLISEPDFELEPIVVSQEHRGSGIGRLLATTVVNASRERGARAVQVRPVGRNVEAIRFFHELGFDILAHVQLEMDLVDRERDPWVTGERIADRDFRY